MRWGINLFDKELAAWLEINGCFMEVVIWNVQNGTHKVQACLLISGFNPNQRRPKPKHWGIINIPLCGNDCQLHLWKSVSILCCALFTIWTLHHCVCCRKQLHYHCCGFYFITCPEIIDSHFVDFVLSSAVHQPSDVHKLVNSLTIVISHYILCPSFCCTSGHVNSHCVLCHSFHSMTYCMPGNCRLPLCGHCPTSGKSLWPQKIQRKPGLFQVL